MTFQFCIMYEYFTIMSSTIVLLSLQILITFQNEMQTKIMQIIKQETKTSNKKTFIISNDMNTQKTLPNTAQN